MKNYSPNIQYFVIILNGWKTGGLEAREDQENEAFKKKKNSPQYCGFKCISWNLE